MIKTIIFDIDGVLIEGDKKIRVEKYKSTFKMGLDLVRSKEYRDSKWLFKKVKKIYDDGQYHVDPVHYKLINKDTAKILKKLSKKYKLYACSLANVETSMEKLKAVGIYKYFRGIMLKPLSNGNKSIAFVDDRYVPKFGKGFYVIKFNYGQHKNQVSKADKVISNLEEL